MKRRELPSRAKWHGRAYGVHDTKIGGNPCNVLASLQRGILRQSHAEIWFPCNVRQELTVVLGVMPHDLVSLIHEDAPAEKEDGDKTEYITARRECDIPVFLPGSAGRRTPCDKRPSAAPKDI